VDKLKSVNHWWRIPECVLLGLAAAGGSVGAYLAWHAGVPPQNLKTAVPFGGINK